MKKITLRPLLTLALAAFSLVLFVTLVALRKQKISQTTPVPVSTKDVPAEWETYTNQEFGFSIKHPSEMYTYQEGWNNTTKTEWLISWGNIPKKVKSELVGLEHNNINLLNKKLSELGYYEIRVYIDTNPRTNTNEPLTEDNFEKRWMDASRLYKFKIQNRPAFRYDNQLDYWIFDKGRLFRISSHDYGQTKNIDSFLDQVLSTFKFLDSKSPTFTPQPQKSGNKCIIGGCNGEICQNADKEPVVSICIYRPEFACYKNAVCEVQENGECGWTMDEKLINCLGASM